VVLGEAQKCVECGVPSLSLNMDALGGTSLRSPRSLVSLMRLESYGSSWSPYTLAGPWTQ